MCCTSVRTFNPEACPTALSSPLEARIILTSCVPVTVSASSLSAPPEGGETPEAGDWRCVGLVTRSTSSKCCLPESAKARRCAVQTKS